MSQWDGITIEITEKGADYYSIDVSVQGEIMRLWTGNNFVADNPDYLQQIREAIEFQAEHLGINDEAPAEAIEAALQAALIEGEIING